MCICLYVYVCDITERSGFDDKTATQLKKMMEEIPNSEYDPLFFSSTLRLHFTSTSFIIITCIHVYTYTHIYIPLIHNIYIHT